MKEKRRLAVDMDSLTGVFELHFDEIQFYFDLETGEVLQVSDETRSLLENLYQELYTDAGERLMSLEALLAQHPEIRDWQKQDVLEADRVEQDYGERIVSVGPEPYSDYNDMEHFIVTVDDDRLAAQLDSAIRGRGAFRRFKNILAYHPQVREAWFAFKAARIQERVRAWLDLYGIEPIE